MKERKLRFGIIGLGKMGVLHASLLNVFPEVELVALCEKSSLVRYIIFSFVSMNATLR